MEDRRNPRRPFDPALIQGFLKGRTLAAVQMLPAGKSNTNYKLVLSDGLVCVLRLCAHGNPARENYVLGLARQVVPVPEVLAQGADWTIYSFLTGEHLANVPAHIEAAARALAAICSIQFESPGWVQADGTIAPFDFGNDDGFVPAMLAREDVQRWLGPQAVSAIFDILAIEARHQQDRPARYCLCHGDYNPTNILIHEGAVSGILDWEFAHAGDLYMDVGNLLRHIEPACHERIRAGLAAGGIDLPADWRVRAEWIDLSSHLEFLTSARSDDFKRQCVHWIHAFVERYRHMANSDR
ncbi:MAG: phosphotransferase [Chloroflexi bacterium]|nr:phosphotransferase [Chloroflexota bacterium]